MGGGGDRAAARTPPAEDGRAAALAAVPLNTRLEQNRHRGPLIQVGERVPQPVLRLVKRIRLHVDVEVRIRLQPRREPIETIERTDRTLLAERRRPEPELKARHLPSPYVPRPPSATPNPLRPHPSEAGANMCSC